MYAKYRGVRGTVVTVVDGFLDQDVHPDADFARGLAVEGAVNHTIYPKSCQSPSTEEPLLDGRFRLMGGRTDAEASIADAGVEHSTLSVWHPAKRHEEILHREVHFGIGVVVEQASCGKKQKSRPSCLATREASTTAVPVPC